MASEKLTKDDVEWVVNDMGELGVKIKDQFFFLYKSRSYEGGRLWRYAGKREFGECAHPVEFYRPGRMKPDNYVGYWEDAEGETADQWQDLPWIEFEESREAFDKRCAELEPNAAMAEMKARAETGEYDE
jgi:hypothetical protein